MIEHVMVSGSELHYHLGEDRDQLFLVGEEIEQPVILDHATAYRVGAALLPGEGVWASPRAIFGSELLDLLPLGSAWFGESGELVVDPALIPPEGLTVWAPVPLRPYLEPVHLRRDNLRFHSVFQWPADSASGTSIPAGVGLFAGFGTPGETGVPASYLEAGLTRHLSNSTWISLWGAAGSPNFAEQSQRNANTGVAANRYAWSSVEGTSEESATASIQLYSSMSDAIDSEVFNGDLNSPKTLTRELLFDWLNQELNSIQTRFYLRLVGYSEWPHAPLKLHALCVR